MKVRVALMEANKTEREALETLINSSEYALCCGAFASGNHWETDLMGVRPDVLVLDIGLPGRSGLEIASLVSQRFPSIRILIQTRMEDNRKIFESLCSGASGYILKDETPARILQSIMEVFNGGAAFSPSVARKIVNFFNDKNVILVAPGDVDYQLSIREKQLLHFMVEGLGLKAIARKTFISYETVRTHVKHIYRKLHVASRSEAILKAKQHGLS